jgi:hypothetical protein
VRVLWAYAIAGLGGAVALLVWYWPGSFFDSTTSAVWLALAWDFAHGTFYRPLISSAGYGGTRYMPLLFVIYGGLLRTKMDPIAAGMIVMHASVFALAFALYRALRVTGTRRSSAVPLAASVFCTAVYQTYCTDVRSDYLAAALSIAAVGSAMRFTREQRTWHLAAAAAACVAAGLTKLTSCAFAASIAAWLLFSRRQRAALLFAAATAVGFGAAFTIANAASSGQLLENLRAMVTAGMTVRDIAAAPIGFLRRIVADPFVLGPAGLAAANCWPGVRTRLRSLPHLYFLSTIAVTVTIFTSPGTVWNHLVDLHAAAVLVVGASMEDSRRLVRAVYAVLAVIALAIAIPLPGIPSVHRTLVRQGPHGGRPRTVVARLHEEFPAPPSRYLSTDPIVPLLHGDRPLLLDAFAMEVFLHAGSEAGRDFRTRVLRHEFDVIIARSDEVRPVRSELIRVVTSAYRIEAVREPFVVFRPR